MINVSTTVKAFYAAVTAVTGIAKAEFVTAFTLEVLQNVKRTPLLLISPHLMNLASGGYRQSGTKLLLNTFLIYRNQRGERNSSAVLELVGILDDLDRALVNNDLGLAIQPVEINRRDAVAGEKGLSVIRTTYSTVIYYESISGRFEYPDKAGVVQTIDYTLVSSAFQTENILDTNDYDRVLDGALRSYGRTPKKKFELRFVLIPTTLKEKFRLMKTRGTEITLYHDKEGGAPVVCFWTNDFNFYEERPGYWTGSVVLLEK